MKMFWKQRVVVVVQVCQYTEYYSIVLIQRRENPLTTKSTNILKRQLVTMSSNYFYPNPSYQKIFCCFPETNSISLSECANKRFCSLIITLPISFIRSTLQGFLLIQYHTHFSSIIINCNRNIQMAKGIQNIKCKNELTPKYLSGFRIICFNGTLQYNVV